MLLIAIFILIGCIAKLIEAIRSRSTLDIIAWVAWTIAALLFALTGHVAVIGGR